MRSTLTAILTFLALLGLPLTAGAAGCFPVAQGTPRLIPASLPAGATVQLTFLGHASFFLETAGGITAITDYNGYLKGPATPDIVTMNNAHSSHYTDHVEPGVKAVLRGWDPAGGEAHHDITMGDLRVRNVPTAVRGRDDARGGSIFVFEVADLCIAHLGHLHQVLTRDQVAALGLIDVLLVPIDGLYTMSQAEMLEVIEEIRPALVIPMHYFGPDVLGRFLSLAKDWDQVISPTPSVALSRATLPAHRILVLPGS